MGDRMFKPWRRKKVSGIPIRKEFSSNERIEMGSRLSVLLADAFSMTFKDVAGHNMHAYAMSMNPSGRLEYMLYEYRGELRGPGVPGLPPVATFLNSEAFVKSLAKLSGDPKYGLKHLKRLRFLDTKSGAELKIVRVERTG